MQVREVVTGNPSGVICRYFYSPSILLLTQGVAAADRMPRSWPWIPNCEGIGKILIFREWYAKTLLLVAVELMGVPWHDTQGTGDRQSPGGVTGRRVIEMRKPSKSFYCGLVADNNGKLWIGIYRSAPSLSSSETQTRWGEKPQRATRKPRR